MRLQGARLAVLPLGHVENHRMGVKLRRSIAFDGPGGVVLEGGGDKFARRLRCVDVADPRLGDTAPSSPKRHADTLPVRLSHPLIAAHKRGK